jgi:hypothetical protein
MKKLSFVYVLLLVLPVVISCQSGQFCISPKGKIVTKSADVKDFDQIYFGIPGKLVFTQAKDYSLKIQTSQNIQNVIEISVKNGKLYIQSDKNICLDDDKKLIVYVGSPKISGLTTFGSGDIVSESSLKAGNLQLRTQGSGDIIITNLQAEGDLENTIAGSGDIIISNSNISVSVRNSTAGSGDIKITNLETPILKNSTAGSGDIIINNLGRANIINSKVAGSGDITVKSDSSISVNKISIAGSGDVKIFVPAEIVQVKTIGSGDAWVNAVKSLDVDIIGSGDVHYKGGAAISSQILGSGDLIKMR